MHLQYIHIHIFGKFETILYSSIGQYHTLVHCFKSDHFQFSYQLTSAMLQLLNHISFTSAIKVLQHYMTNKITSNHLQLPYHISFT